MMHHLRRRWLQILWMTVFFTGCERDGGATETLVITGSDTMAGLLTAWSAVFSELSPDAVIEIQASGSAAAPIALAEGTASLGAMSRAMSAAELARFQEQRGYLPTVIPVANDALALIVHIDNPISSLSLPEIDGIYSATQFCGGRAYTDWRELLGAQRAGQIGLPAIEAYGRASISGSYGFFKNNALCAGDYSPRVVELPGFAAIADSVADLENAIGYVSLGYVDSRVKLVPVRLEGDDGSANDPGLIPGAPSYPLARTLYLYLSVPPDKKAPPLACEFLRFVATPVAQDRLSIEGFSAVPDLEEIIQSTVFHVCD